MLLFTQFQNSLKPQNIQPNNRNRFGKRKRKKKPKTYEGKLVFLWVCVLFFEVEDKRANSASGRGGGLISRPEVSPKRTPLPGFHVEERRTRSSSTPKGKLSLLICMMPVGKTHHAKLIPKSILGHLLYPQPIHRGAVTNGMKISSYCILKQSWVINKKAISIWALQVYQSHQDHLYPQPPHLSGRNSRATSQTRTALASI